MTDDAFGYRYQAPSPYLLVTLSDQPRPVLYPAPDASSSVVPNGVYGTFEIGRAADPLAPSTALSTRAAAGGGVPAGVTVPTHVACILLACLRSDLLPGQERAAETLRRATNEALMDKSIARTAAAPAPEISAGSLATAAAAALDRQAATTETPDQWADRLAPEFFADLDADKCESEFDEVELVAAKAFLGAQLGSSRHSPFSDEEARFWLLDNGAQARALKEALKAARTLEHRTEP